jgi:carbon monoxide dehydrogenase subunit G
MKFLQIALIVIIVLVVLVYGVAYLQPAKINLQREVQIKAPRSQVYALVSNPEAWSAALKQAQAQAAAEETAAIKAADSTQVADKAAKKAKKKKRKVRAHHSNANDVQINVSESGTDISIRIDGDEIPAVLRVVEKKENESVTFKLVKDGLPVNVDGKFSLADKDGGTQLVWSGNVDMSGSSPLYRYVNFMGEDNANRLVDRGLEMIKEALEKADISAASAGPAPKAPTAPQAPVAPAAK